MRRSLAERNKMNYRDLVEKLSAIELGEEGVAVAPATNSYSKPKPGQTMPSDDTAKEVDPSMDAKAAIIPGQQPDIGHGSKLPPGSPITPQGATPAAPVNPNNSQANDIKNQISAMQNALMALRNPPATAPTPAMQPTTNASVDKQSAMAAQQSSNMRVQPKPGEPTRPILEADTQMSVADQKKADDAKALAKAIAAVGAKINRSPTTYMSSAEWKKIPDDVKKQIFAKDGPVHPDIRIWTALGGKLDALDQKDPEFQNKQKELLKQRGEAWSRWSSSAEGKPAVDPAKAAEEKARNDREAEAAKNNPANTADAKAKADAKAAEEKARKDAEEKARKDAEEKPKTEAKPKKYSANVTSAVGMGSKDKPNDAVKKMQQQLVDAGYGDLLGNYGEKGDGVDGVFRGATQKALAKFQADNKLKDQKGRAAGNETNPVLAKVAAEKKRESEVIRTGSIVDTVGRGTPGAVRYDQTKQAMVDANGVPVVRKDGVLANTSSDANTGGTTWRFMTQAEYDEKYGNNGANNVEPSIASSSDGPIPGGRDDVAIKMGLKGSYDSNDNWKDESGKTTHKWSNGAWKPVETAVPADVSAASSGQSKTDTRTVRQIQIDNAAKLENEKVKEFLAAHPGVTYKNGQFKDEKGQQLGSWNETENPDTGKIYGIDISARKDFKTAVPGVHTGTQAAEPAAQSSEQETPAQKLEREKRERARAEVDGKAEAPANSGNNTFKASHRVPNRFTVGDTQLMQRDGKFYTQDGKEWTAPFLSKEPSLIAPATGTSPVIPKAAPPGKASDKVSAYELDPETADAMVRQSTLAERRVSLASVVDELLAEGGATATANKDNKSVWQSTKDTVSKATNAVADTVPKPVKDTLTKVGNHPATKLGVKALGPAATVYGASTIPDDAYDSMKKYDDGDTVGAFLKGGQAALNTAMIPTTAAALIPGPHTPFALGADAVMGLASLGLAGTEYVRDKYFPYKNEYKSVMDNPAKEELDRVVSLTKYKAGK
jgi:hypothetical protein